MYRLTTVHTAQRHRQMDGQTDDIIMSLADHRNRSWSTSS